MDAGSPARRGARLGAAAMLVLASATAIASAPAAAIEVSTGTSDVMPVTWVDGAGRQYVALSAGVDGTLQVARDTRGGEPDATWGTLNGKKGRRALAIGAPAAGATMHRLLSAGDDGTITTVWETASCASPTATCDRWYVRVSPTGKAVGSPTAAPASAPPRRGLTDGSILTGAPGGSVGWRAPTGADRGTLPLATSDLAGAAVDGGGRLLVTSDDGVITRWPAGGPADLTLPTACTGGLAIGAGLADDGFATACGAASAASVVTTRYELDGSVRWSTTGVPVDKAALQPSLVTVDAADHVWIAGLGTTLNNGYNLPIAALASVDGDGARTAGYQRPRQGIGNVDRPPTGITDLRPVLGDHVAFVDLHNCCQYSWGPVPMTSIIGQILPKPAIVSAPPTCVPRSVEIVAATRTTATVSFQGCAAGSGGPAPTGYLVEDRNFSNPLATTTELPSSPDAPLTATLTAPAPPGIALYVSPINEDGSGPSAPFLTTFLPFRTFDEYIDRQFRDLIGHAPSAAERSEARGTWVYNHDASGLVSHLIDTGRAPQAVEPIARLYRAYFGRDADIGGLRYWVHQREAGATLARVSEQFARSGEFTRRYGTLSNRAFVERIYTDVLGRTGDPTGVDFWTRQLDSGKKNRGAVMVNFSESGEYRTKMARHVEPVAAFFLMLDRLPTASDRALTSEWSRSAVAYAIFRTPEYDGRVP
ncbi:MAG: hypothetical protein JWO77_906 [Ilumatobacteraceae bacterium]|nr:hypothetical protein [Ilumatobacteraceae bacterium]